MGLFNISLSAQDLDLDLEGQSRSRSRNLEKFDLVASLFCWLPNKERTEAQDGTAFTILRTEKLYSVLTPDHINICNPYVDTRGVTGLKFSGFGFRVRVRVLKVGFSGFGFGFGF